MDVIGLAILLAVGLVAYWLLLTGYTAWMLMRPPRRTYAWAVARTLPGTPGELPEPVAFEAWTFRARGVDLPAWTLRGGDPEGSCIVLTHGWGDSRVTMLASGRIESLLPMCARLVLWDLPGHGDAPGGTRCGLGEPESGDLAVLVDHLARPARAVGSAEAAQPVVLFGFSMGAVVSLRAAAGNSAVRAVIAEAAYTAPWIPARNVLRVRRLPHLATLPPALALIGMRHGKGLAWWPRPGDRPPDWLPTARITQPTLLLHGESDSIVPISCGEQLARELPNATLLRLPGRDHHTLWTDPAARAAAQQAITTLLRGPAGTPVPVRDRHELRGGPDQGPVSAVASRGGGSA